MFTVRWLFLPSISVFKDVMELITTSKYYVTQAFKKMIRFIIKKKYEKVTDQASVGTTINR